MEKHAIQYINDRVTDLHFDVPLFWQGERVLQLPNDLFMVQELIHKLKPNVVVETGTFKGGCALFYADMLEKVSGMGKVITIDVKPYNRGEARIQSKTSTPIEFLQGMSCEEKIVAEVKRGIETTCDNPTVLFCLDSDHSTENVYKELTTYVDMAAYFVVYDTSMAYVADDLDKRGKKWIKIPTAENNPLVAVERFLSERDDFEVDRHYNRWELTFCPKGFLKRK